jgi:hypothetical protein
MPTKHDLSRPFNFAASVVELAGPFQAEFRFVARDWIVVVQFYRLRCPSAYMALRMA